MKTKLPSSRLDREDSLPHEPRAPGKAIQELAREQGARPFDPQTFAGIIPPGEDIVAFVEEIYSARA